jgi:hypothetical protein
VAVKDSLGFVGHTSHFYDHDGYSSAHGMTIHPATVASSNVRSTALAVKRPTVTADCGVTVLVYSQTNVRECANRLPAREALSILARCGAEPSHERALERIDRTEARLPRQLFHGPVCFLQ